MSSCFFVRPRTVGIWSHFVKKQTIVLGGGIVGAVMAMDLAADEDREVTLYDADSKRLESVVGHHKGLKGVQADLSDPAVVTKLACQADLVLGALPGRLGLQTLEAVIESGTPYCDISFMPEDGWHLSAKAEATGCVAVIDCGVAPGISNLLAGVAAHRFSPCHRICIRVGGLPVHPQPPWMYKASFSPSDVIEEYVRPARLVEDGKVVIRPALSEPVQMEFPEVGVLEAFNTDGLRSLTETLSVPHMLEQTLRYPGHREQVLLLRESGFLDTAPIQVGEICITPRDVTCGVLFPQWTYAPGEQDLTIMRVEAWGDLDGMPHQLTWDLFDRLDPKTGWTSMARTTAFPATIMARLIESQAVAAAGVHAPESLAHREDVVEAMFSGLAKRGVTYRESLTPVTQD